ncbi:MAG TPA: VWA domain-containing protein, partial [Crenotrichaceae bacterium]|nr:VWA domain-containing protein [Crenotrichaceae bacterium]
SDIKTIKVLKKEDLVATKHVNEEQYLIGLQVKGRKIAILVDHSASMTDEKLIDIIKTKNGSVQSKQRAKKWIRTKKVVQWLLARLPSNSDVIAIAFNDKARTLGHNGWVKASAAASIPAILSDLNTLTPEGATNLQRGLQLVNKYAPSNIYLITDGLPTKGESRYKSLNPFASCSSLLGNSKIISGACRVMLFRQTIAETSVKNAQTNIILLPLEGDPDAIDQYWGWSAVTGGLVLNPANNWP